jgi:hypothetical protein
MKTYNIGVTTRSGENFGFVIVAENADRAYERAVNHCAANDIPLMPGHAAQRREDHGVFNEWFDRTYPTRVMML